MATRDRGADARLKSDLVEVMLACAEQRLDEVELEWCDEWAVRGPHERRLPGFV
ncbi:MAG: hypothetical protein ACLTKG_00120 [Collinsella intestinalis]